MTEFTFLGKRFFKACRYLAISTMHRKKVKNLYIVLTKSGLVL